jgi:hypothetical protein
VIEQDCRWERPGAPAPFSDRRVITLSAPSPDLRLIDFDVTLKALVEVRIGKTNHSFFSVRADPRLAPAGGGELANAAGDRGEKDTFGKAAAWAAFRGRLDGHAEGVGLLVAPTNRWAPTPWFTRDYGFMSPTPMFWPEDGKATKLAAGEELRLRYRVVVFGGDLPAAGLQALHDGWAATLK